MRWLIDAIESVASTTVEMIEGAASVAGDIGDSIFGKSVTSHNNFREDVSAQMEREQDKLACEKARIGLRTFLEGKGIQKSSGIFRRIEPAKIEKELERDEFFDRCMAAFMETDAMSKLNIELKKQRIKVRKIKIARENLHKSISDY